VENILIMKKLFVILLLLTGTLSYSQTKPKTKDIDKDANVLLDSLSKVYKVRVNSIFIESYNGETITSISYVENRELIYKVIKVVKNKKD
jgi:hypothetical protein